MKQVLQNRKTGRPFVGEVPVPALQKGRVLVRTVTSLISAGTERAAVELVSKGLVQEARQRPDLVKAIVAKVKSEGLLNTFASVRDKMAASQSLGYSAAGIVEAVAEDVTEFRAGDRVACAGVGFASHAEVLSVPKNLCVHLPEGVSFESGAYGTLGAIALQGVRLAEPTLGLIRRVLGQSEDEELRRLAVGVAHALDSLPGIQEKRWYPDYRTSVERNAAFSHAPEL